MHFEGFFLQALVYLSASVVAVPIAKRLGLGSVLGPSAPSRSAWSGRRART